MKYRVHTTHIIEAKSKGQAYFKLMKSSFQNEFLLKAITKTKGPLLIDLANELDYKELKRLLLKYPEYTNRLPKQIKDKLNPSLIKRLLKEAAKAAIFVSVAPGMLNTKQWMKEAEKKVAKEIIKGKTK